MVAAVLAGLFVAQAGGVWTFIVVLALAFFLASAGASAAYLTVSEIFPMETRALAIAFFYAVGTAIGGITGPLLFGQLINSGQRGLVVWSFLIGAAVMAVAGLVELLARCRGRAAPAGRTGVAVDGGRRRARGTVGNHQVAKDVAQALDAGCALDVILEHSGT